VHAGSAAGRAPGWRPGGVTDGGVGDAAVLKALSPSCPAPFSPLTYIAGRRPATDNVKLHSTLADLRQAHRPCTSTRDSGVALTTTTASHCIMERFRGGPGHGVPRRSESARGPCDNDAMPDLDLGTILTAIVTPFDERGGVDEGAFVALMAHLAENGSDGFVVAGTTGEAATMTDEEHLGLIGLAAAERPPGTSIVAGTGTNDTRHAVLLTERATELGVDALLSVTPYYNRPSPLGLRRHYEAVA